MTDAIIRDESGQIEELQEDGDVVRIRRDKISEESKQKLLDAVINKSGDKFRREAFKILTGETVEEAQEEE